MKTKLRLVLAGSITLIGAAVALTQQSHSQSATGIANRSPKAKAPPMNLFYVDDKTKEVVGSNRGHSKKELASLNTPEQIFLRKKSAMSLLNPAEYERQFPKSNAELAVELEAAYAITQPAENFARVRRSKTPDQIAKEDQAILEILNPQPRSR